MLKSHEKHGNPETLIRYTAATESAGAGQLAQSAEGFRRLTYLSQISQAYGVGLGIMGQRLLRNHSWGTLYWQFNDAWPAISWSSLDYYGNWKALQYAAKVLYEGIMVGFTPTREGPEQLLRTVAVKVVNDYFQEVRGRAAVYAVGLAGEELYKKEFTEDHAVQENEVVQLDEISLQERSLSPNFVLFAYFTE